MISDFKKIRQLGAFLAKEHAVDLLRLLYLYKDISASEAASRLSIHIRTVQDFFDALHESDVLIKEEVFEKKRPYFRYTLKIDKIICELDISALVDVSPTTTENKLKIREHKNASVHFTTSRNNLYFSSVTIWIGEGRGRSEKKVNLTNAQGKFLFNLPFPETSFLSVDHIMKKTETTEEHRQEIMDIVNLLIEHGVIEIEK